MGQKTQQQKSMAATKLVSRRRALQVLAVSIFSILLLSCYSSSIIWFLGNINNFMINRKLMFILFNAILLFLAKNSGSFSSSVSGTEHSEIGSEATRVEKAAFESDVISSEKVVLEVEEEYEDAIKEEEEVMDVVTVDEMEHLEVEELNKKFEEFIEKVKRDRILEAMKLVMIS